ncbi:MAG: ABC transporter permease [Nocardioides sp.]
MMLLDLSRHTVRRNIAPYVGSFVALFLGVTLIGLTVEMIMSANRYGATLGASDMEGMLQVNDLLSMFGVMSGFSGFMAIFVVASTFSFVVSSRQRELGQLRLVGATPRQVRRMILGESLIVAAAASVAGSLLAHLLTPAALWLTHNRGLTPAGLETPPWWSGLVIAAPIGLFVALLGARAASKRASKISPIDAMRESAVDGRRLGFLRIMTGLCFLTSSIAMLVMMGASTGILSMLLGIFVPEMLVISAVCFGPVLFPALAKLIAWPFAKRDIAIRMARDNVAAAGKQTASLAAPTLAISAIAGSLILTLGIGADFDNAINKQQLAAPIVVTTNGDADVATILDESDDVRTADTVLPISLTTYGSEGERELQEAEGVDVANAATARTLTAKKGDLDDLQGNTVAMSDEFIMDSGFHMGQAVKVTLDDGKPIRLKIVAVTHAAPTLQADILVPADLARQHGAHEVDRVYVIPNDGVSISDVKQDLAGTDATVDTKAAWIDAADKEIRRNNQLSLWVLLGPAGIYAAMAIANTLLMGSIRRRRELVSTTLIGATKQQRARWCSGSRRSSRVPHWHSAERSQRQSEF